MKNLALLKFKNHCWNLSEELITLSFYDDKVSHEMKRKMIKSLTRPSVPEPPKKTERN